MLSKCKARETKTLGRLRRGSGDGNNIAMCLDIKLRSFYFYLKTKPNIYWFQRRPLYCPYLCDKLSAPQARDPTHPRGSRISGVTAMNP